MRLLMFWRGMENCKAARNLAVNKIWVRVITIARVSRSRHKDYAPLTTFVCKVNSIEIRPGLLSFEDEIIRERFFGRKHFVTSTSWTPTMMSFQLTLVRNYFSIIWKLFPVLGQQSSPHPINWNSSAAFDLTLQSSPVSASNFSYLHVARKPIRSLMLLRRLFSPRAPMLRRMNKRRK